jgi:hypothetical protein
LAQASTSAARKNSGSFLAFDCTEDALRDIDRAFKDDHAVIVPLAVQEILDDQIARVRWRTVWVEETHYSRARLNQVACGWLWIVLTQWADGRRKRPSANRRSGLFADTCAILLRVLAGIESANRLAGVG